MKTKKLLSILLALMMMLSVVPMYASAADPIALTEANVTVWPTASGEIYFGQKLSDGITLSGGEVQYDGVVVAGHFEFIDPNYLNTKYSSQNLSDIKFVPDDNSTYIGFEILESFDVLYNMNKTTPIFVDENDTIPVATEVEPGAKLSTSILSGAQVMNPYYPEEPKVLAGVWKWAKGSTIVSESGYYEARITVSGYERLSAQVYVKVKENTVNTTIAEAPSVGELTYDANKTWADVTLTGGKAVEEGTETEVTGTFAITKVNGSSVLWNKVITDGDIVEITFTPSDTDKYLTSTTTITASVNKAPIKFVDENGAEIVPEITVPYGTKLTDGNMRYYISQAGCTAVAGNDGCWYDGTDADGYIFGTSASGEAPEVGTHYYEFIARPYTTVGVTSYYEETVLKLKVTVTPVEAEMKLDTSVIKGTDGFELWVWNKDTSSAARPEGTFTVYLDGAVYKENLKYGEHFTWQPTESKTYEFKATYTPTENDPFTIADFTMSRDIKLTRKLTASENILNGYGDFKYGTAVEINANVASDNFAGWKITDVNGKEVALDGVDNSKTKITITMPDYDIHVEALEKNASSGGSGGLGDIDFGDLSEGDSEWAIINIIRNIIAMFKSFLQQLIETFQSIGD